MQKRKILFSIIFTILGLLAFQVSIDHVIGSTQNFTLFEFLAPIGGMFLGPILGALSTLFFTVPAYFLTLYLGFFAGFLLYIGASDILPEAHSKQSSYKLMGLTVLGTLFIFIITRLI